MQSSWTLELPTYEYQVFRKLFNMMHLQAFQCHPK